TTGRLWQKCHTGSFSDSRLLREARILHYVPTSRSARIVVKPLHESPGPTTAGASLFCVSFSPRPSPERPVRLILWSGADLAKAAEDIPIGGVGKIPPRVSPRIGRAPACVEGRVRIAPPPGTGASSHRSFGAGDQIAKASSDPARQ